MGHRGGRGLLKVSAAKVSEVRRTTAIPSPKHTAVDIDSPSEAQQNSCGHCRT